MTNAKRFTNRNKRPARKRKRVYKKKTTRVGRPAISTIPSVYFFKRHHTETVMLSTGAPPDSWSVLNNGLGKQMVYSLSQLGDFTDFTNLFAQYKLTAIKMELLFSNSVSISNSGYSNNQLLVYTDSNNIGTTETLPESLFLTSQTSRKRVCLTNSQYPIKFYNKLRQLRETYNGPTGTDYAMSYPRWISTGESTTPHYGMNIRIQRVDGQAMPAVTGAPTQYMKIFTTYYIACKKVE